MARPGPLVRHLRLGMRGLLRRQDHGRIGSSGSHAVRADGQVQRRQPDPHTDLTNQAKCGIIGVYRRYITDMLLTRSGCAAQ